MSNRSSCPVYVPTALDHLVERGDPLDEVSLNGRCYTAAICSLCAMCPIRATHVQLLSIRAHNHPGLTLLLALEGEERRERERERRGEGVAGTSTSRGGGGGGGVCSMGVVELLHSILVTGDEKMKNSFAQYMKLMQQKVCACTHTHIHTHTCTHTHTHTHGHTHTHTHSRTHMDTHTHTRTHTVP